MSWVLCPFSVLSNCVPKQIYISIPFLPPSGSAVFYVQQEEPGKRFSHIQSGKLPKMFEQKTPTHKTTDECLNYNFTLAF